METKLYRFTIDEYRGENETTHELYVKANCLTSATTAATEYAATFYEDALQETGEDGSLYWLSPLGEVQWEVGSITQLACIAITPINAPVIYLPLPAEI